MFVLIRMLPHGSQPAVLIADKIPDYRQIYMYFKKTIYRLSLYKMFNLSTKRWKLNCNKYKMLILDLSATIETL